MNTKSKSKKGIIGITLTAIMIASIFAAINPVPVAARMITLDGNSASYVGEWDSNPWPTGDFVVTDPTGDAPGGDIHGYDITDVYSHYDKANNTMYFRLDVQAGEKPADLDGDGSTDTDCSITPGPGDCPGVGQYEQYTISVVDNSSSGLPGATLEYKDNAVALADGDAQWGSNCVEFSLANADTYIDPLDFCIAVTCGGQHDGPGEDTLDICLYGKVPPEIHIDYEATGCLAVNFTLWADDNSSIVNYTLKFGDGDEVSDDGPFPVTEPHTYTSAGTKHAQLTACNAEECVTTTKDVDVAGKPTARISYSPSCFEINGTLITFDGSGSSGESTPLSYNWTFTGGFTGDNDNGKITNVTVDAPMKATLTVTDTLGCEDNTSVDIDQCSGCTLRLYGTYGMGAGDFSAKDNWTGMEPENKPYTDPLGPFFPQHEQAPRKDFITFNPAIMPHNSFLGYDLAYPGLDTWECVNYSDTQQPAEKVFKRMWYEKDWFKDSTQNGSWDVVTIDGKVMTLDEWSAIPAWERPTLREFNSPNARDYNPDADIYGPAIIQEFTYMAVDQEYYMTPRFIGIGSNFLIPMASYKQGNGLDSFDADGDGNIDYVKIIDEKGLIIRWVADGMSIMDARMYSDIDGDWLFGPKPGPESLDNDGEELSGDESVIFSLDNMPMVDEGTIQFFDHVVKLKDVQQVGIEGWGIFEVCDNEGVEGDPAQRCALTVPMKPGTVKYFYRGEERVRIHPAERPTFYLRLITADAEDNTATVEVGRVFGETTANINGLNRFWSQKAFMVDGVLYETVAIKAQDSCFKYITFRQKLPKTPIKLYGKHLERWDPGEVLPEMPPFNDEHYILKDVLSTWDPVEGKEDKYGRVNLMPPLVIDYVWENNEYRYKGELKEILSEEFESIFSDEWWNLEWFWTQPWQYTEFRLPKDDKYLVTLSWESPESEFVLWDSDPNGPVANWSYDRVKFWYEDCTGPIYIDNETRSIRLYGTFGEGAGDQNATDIEDGESYGMEPENKPYTDPEGPFDPESEQAPVKDFMTFNPAIMDHNQGYSELDFYECIDFDSRVASDVQIPKEKVFKRMWYEKEWFKDSTQNGSWDVVTVDKYGVITVMTLEEWLDIPLEERPAIREWNSDGQTPSVPDPTGTDWLYDADADIYGPAIVQEFTYFTTDDNTQPIFVGAGSKVLIPMATWDTGDGLDSFDADGDGARDAVAVEGERNLWYRWGLPRAPDDPLQPAYADIDGDAPNTGIFAMENMGGSDPGLMEDNIVILSLQNKYMDKSDEIRFFDHRVVLNRVDVLGTEGWAIFEVYDLEGVSPDTSPEVVSVKPGEVAYFYRGDDKTNDRTNPAERPVFYLRLLSADSSEDTAIVEVGRMFGQTTATINGLNPFWSQKAFMVDGVLYEVVAIHAEDGCFKYMTFRQKLPKYPIKLWGVHLKPWERNLITNESEILPEMPPFNEDHEILIDVQSTWTRPYTPYDKVGEKVSIGPLEIKYVDENIEDRFKGALKEIYNETWINGFEEEYWNVEWFLTQPWQYTAFVMPEDQIYLVTLSWIAPEAENTIWNHDPNGPVEFINGSRVKFWYDGGEPYLYDLYVNQMGAARPEPTIWEYYDLAANGGNKNDRIDLKELVAAIQDYLWETYPFGDGRFDKGDLLDYLQAFIDQENL